MDVLFDRGVHLPSLDLWMDALRGRAGCWVSHGHTDHMAAHKHFLATGPTGDILRRRHARSQALEVDYGQPVAGPGYQMTLYPAGHCLGSAQMLIETEQGGQRIVYTGDFKLRPNPTTPSAPILPCDTLIIESTFGHSRYAFPPEEETLDMLAGFVERCFARAETPVVLTYSLGKGQEALYHLLARGYSVRYDHSIGQMVELYQHWGVDFVGDHAEAESDGLRDKVVLLPPGGRRGAFYKSIPRPRTALLTGWALDQETRYRFRVDDAFPLSDHAGFPDLLRYVQESGARTVFTVNGFPDLAVHLRDQGIPAKHLDRNTSPLQLALPL